MKVGILDKITFGYSHPLKEAYKKGQLPTVTKGFYGGDLTKQNVTLEHLIPCSKGGKTTIDNLVLATKENNMQRSNHPLKLFVNPEQARQYLEQFKGMKLGNLRGDDYIKLILKTLKKLGIEL